MGANRIKKGERGEVTKYITRNKAIKRLQLSLHDFRRLCILKGIYPREPKHRKRVQKGNSEYKTQYYLKDIQFLSHEPLIARFRAQRAHLKKMKSALGKRDTQEYDKLRRNKPTYRIDHLVRERYPTFVDALRDLDDPLTLCFLFSRLNKKRFLAEAMIMYCRRLTVEFMHYVIAAKALRKVFISIKGYYYQAEVMGQTVTWIVPHPFRPENTTEVDFSIMKLFTEFYICMLGFVNYRLYQSLNLFYPPKLDGDEEVKETRETEDDNEVEIESLLISERIASLNIELKKNKLEEDDEETMDMHLLEESVQNVKRAMEEEEKLNKFKNLFQNLKFFLGRETNMESLTFVIRSFGGKVSWDESVAEGSLYPESDETITHQIVDRPDVERKYLSRYYVQPQWVYDCINARMFLPVQDYFPGVTLPPHLSPFDIVTDLYVPPEKEKLEAMKRGEIPVHAFPQDQSSDEESDEDAGGDENEEEVEEDAAEEETVGAQEEEPEVDPEKKQVLEKMEVKPGIHVRPKDTTWKDEQDHYRLSVSMIPRKKKKIYRKLKRQENKQFYKCENLRLRRLAIEKEKAKKLEKTKGSKANNEKKLLKAKMKQKAQ
ncbi:pescadillo [Palaemon carinicauda]|uniref:pescadillo n=1 Tax=Palaemon carinicauda TaxID=392227 RepID=UPI0035B58AF3